ncbi:Gcp-like domain-containing protein [Crucibulum laeve]|uniref:N(6)-L-threonylcarbamoyladenine synthase n=1 Tax=Crucibulum laeve TaxID=68775 RepID=A0A5C3MIQ4_9AGAR|nr:Gcp-like domain-containing protein [Crucibulum laeve]
MMSLPCFRSLARIARPRLLRLTRNFTVLAIESSADDTCAAVVTSSRQILSNVVIKQHELHEEYGGIYPPTAIHAHQRNMPFAVKRALSEANVDIIRDIDGIAVTRGPGMPGCLSVGTNAAKTLAAALNKPLVGVHHMQGHALTAIFTSESGTIKFPFLTLLISGGHTLLLLATDHHSFRILATTEDESIGRTFDKVSKLLALKWTALGPGDALEKFCAEEADEAPVEIPPITRPLIGKMQFSYSGLHSNIERFVHRAGGIENIDISTKRALARAFQEAAVKQLEEKVLLALQSCRQKGIHIQNLVVSGGVASNHYLRGRLQQCVITESANQNSPISLVFPPPYLCTDNAVMIGWASMHRFLAGDYDDYGVELQPKWSIEDLLIL